MGFATTEVTIWDTYKVLLTGSIVTVRTDSSMALCSLNYHLTIVPISTLLLYTYLTIILLTPIFYKITPIYLSNKFPRLIHSTPSDTLSRLSYSCLRYLFFKENWEISMKLKILRISRWWNYEITKIINWIITVYLMEV